MLSRLFILALFFTVAITSCNDDDNNDDLRVPNVNTNIDLNLNLPQYNPLQNPGSWVYVTGGSRGIIVYRVGIEQFAAFDRHCTYNVQEGCQIVAEEGSTVAKDEECCNSEFEIITGGPTEGPARRPLRQYNTQFNPNANTLRVYN
jgi:nitrite reductase/ring-hydroxylating ferredoxin subunit